MSGEFEIPPSWANHWHIDGLGDYENKTRTAMFGDINNFTALIGNIYSLCDFCCLCDHCCLFFVGVVLQDADEDFMGNLVVYPGSHFELQNHFQVSIMRILHGNMRNKRSGISLRGSACAGGWLRGGVSGRHSRPSPYPPRPRTSPDTCQVNECL